MSLDAYSEKRDFERTPEPEGEVKSSAGGRLFVIQKHAANRLHYDFRIEMDGVLKSWAVPKGPSLNPADKRLAIHVEDHPVSYGDFEGAIPEEEYGGGTVMLWDRGTWEPIDESRPPEEALKEGSLKLRLHGEKLSGGWALIRMDEEEDNWLLIKEKDDEADRETDITEERPNSALSGRSLEEIAESPEAVWKEGRSRPADNPDSNSSNTISQPAMLDSLPEELLPQNLPGSQEVEALPEDLEPQMATLVDEAPQGENWLHEIKFDGYRLLGYRQGEQARLITRNGKNWTDRFPAIVEAIAGLPVQPGILDGEVVVLNPDGTTDFQALQNALKGKYSERLVYYIFDLPFYAGYDLRRTPLARRKELLAAVLAAAPEDRRLRYSSHIQGQGAKVLHNACRMALEGMISKDGDSPYESKRTRTWVKVKCIRRQEFVVGGYTDPQGSRTHFGALALGYYDDDGRLIYAGRVGTGFTQETLAELYDMLQERGTDENPFDEPPAGTQRRGVHWVKPELVAEVEFSNWTRDGLVRQASFQGLRQDKAPDEVRREQPEHAPPGESRGAGKGEASGGDGDSGRKGSDGGKMSRKDSVEIAGVRLSSPERVLFPEQGVTKRELAEFYEKIAEWGLPHVTGRPLSLVRCPRGREDQCFFQKNYSDSLPEAVRRVELTEASGEEATYITIEDLPGLISLVQVGVLELHPWGSRNDRLEHPDQMIFDLDPAPGVGWEEVVKAAQEVRSRFEELGLESFVKTSGGKGLHVVVPLAQRSDWDEVGDFAEALAKDIARRRPEEYIAEASKSKREGKIFVDYLRNRRGSTSIAAYSTRAREGAPVSTPVRWDEVTSLEGAQDYTIANLPRRLAALQSDPWEGFFDLDQSITGDMKQELGLR